MKKVLIVAILALNIVSLSYLALSQTQQSFTINSAIAESGHTKYTCTLDQFSLQVPVDCYDSLGNHYDSFYASYYDRRCEEDENGNFWADISCFTWYYYDYCTERDEEGPYCIG